MRLMILFVKLQSVAEDWDVEAMPTFVLMKEGKILDRILGAKKDELQLAITKHATTETEAATVIAKA